MSRLRVAALLLGLAGLQAAECAETVLFIGNSFTAGAGSPVEHYRPETVTDLTGGSVGGLPSLFESLARQAGLEFDVQLEVAGGTNLDFHEENKAALIGRPWDHVVLQGHSLLDADSPGDAGKIVEYAARLAQRVLAGNPDADVRLFATWSRADQTYVATGHWFGRPIEAMAVDVRAAYDAAIVRTPRIRAVIPVGEAWNRAISEGIATRDPYAGAAASEVNLWAADGYHASASGSYLAALVIFGSITGRDPRELGAEEEAAAKLGIAPDTARALQRIAFETLAAERPR